MQSSKSGQYVIFTVQYQSYIANHCFQKTSLNHHSTRVLRESPRHVTIIMANTCYIAFFCSGTALRSTTKVVARHSFLQFRSRFSSSTQMSQKLRIGFVPEHFSTPLAFAQQRFNLPGDLTPEPLGTGALTSRLKASSSDENALDVAVGLTEGFVADLGKIEAKGEDVTYGIVGTYVESPLCWAISTGAKRDDLKSVTDLKNKRVGVSRIGSGSYVMSYVLADQQGWLEQGKDPFGIVVAGNFEALRASVNLAPEEEGKESEFFMWEHFTTKKYWDDGEIKRIGEIYTPWASWMVTARHSVKEQIPGLMESINKGVKHFKQNPEEAVKHITSTMHYSEDDARQWMKTVKFPDDVSGVNRATVDNTIDILRTAGVLGSKAGKAEKMITNLT